MVSKKDTQRRQIPLSTQHSTPPSGNVRVTRSGNIVVTSGGASYPLQFNATGSQHAGDQKQSDSTEAPDETNSPIKRARAEKLIEEHKVNIADKEKEIQSLENKIRLTIKFIRSLTVKEGACQLEIDEHMQKSVGLASGTIDSAKTAFQLGVLNRIKAKRKQLAIENEADEQDSQLPPPDKKIDQPNTETSPPNEKKQPTGFAAGFAALHNARKQTNARQIRWQDTLLELQDKLLEIECRKRARNSSIIDLEEKIDYNIGKIDDHREYIRSIEERDWFEEIKEPTTAQEKSADTSEQSYPLNPMLI